MHFVVSWDVSADGTRWTEINEQMLDCLSGYSWVKALSTFRIVRVRSQNEWASIKEALVAVAESTPEKVHFVMSPLMEGGSYGGWLPKSLWPKIRERTE